MRLKNAIPKTELELCGTDFSAIRNLREFEVLEAMGEYLEKFPDTDRSRMFLKDVYACALNKLPAKYVQEITFDVRPERSISLEKIQRTVHEAFVQVNMCQKGPEVRPSAKKP